MNQKRYEILAPVGTLEMFEAALASGADAVYLAGEKFGARNLINKFEIKDIEQIVKKSHIYDIKVYITINTLVKDFEFYELYEYIYDLVNINIDAVIVQDLGVYYFIKKHFPNLELHASTQMAVNTLYGAKYIESLGFSRVVVGRETDFSEINKISKYTSLEIEAFVHGALCVCISGKCLMSSLIGGRSGNRGKCAQPCRKSFDIYDIKGNKISKLSDNFISAKDLCLIDDVNDIIDLGVYSLKIEGRLKKPEYVYQVVKEYKKAIENCSHNFENLSQVSNRTFTKGLANGDFGRAYYSSKKDIAGLKVGKIVKENGKVFILLSNDLFKKDTLSIENIQNSRFNITLTEDFYSGQKILLDRYRDSKEGSYVYKLFSEKIRENLLSDLKDMQKIKLDFIFTAKIGEKLKLVAYKDEKKYEVFSDFIVQEAKNKSILKDEIVERMSKLGNTAYYLSSIDLKVDENIFLPVSSLNNLKRDLVEKINNSYSSNVLFNTLDNRNTYKKTRFSHLKLSLEIFGKLNKNLNFEKFERIYVHDFELAREIRKMYSKEIYYIAKKVMIQEEYDNLEKTIEENYDYIDGFSANDMGEYLFYRKFNKNIHIENYVNIFNSKTIEFLKEQGISSMSISEELNLEEILSLNNSDCELEIIGYGQLSSMIIKHCPASVIKGCKDSLGCNNCRFNRIKMENEFDKFEVIRKSGYSEILTEKEKNILPIMDKIKNNNISMIRLIDRDDDKIVEITNNFINSIKGKKYTKKTYLGHIDKGVL